MTGCKHYEPTAADLAELSIVNIERDLENLIKDIDKNPALYRGLENQVYQLKTIATAAWATAISKRYQSTTGEKR